jgi:spore germination protein KB
MEKSHGCIKKVGSGVIKDGHISYKSWLTIVVIATTGKIFNPSFSILTSYGERTTYLMCIFAGAINYVVCIFLLRFMRNYPHQGILTVFELRSGKWAAKSYGAVSFLGVLFNGFINTRLFADQTKVVALPKTPLSFLLLCAIVVSCYIAVKGFEGVARITSVFFPWMIITIILLVVLVINRFHVYYLFPLLGPGLKTIILEGVKHSLYFAEPLALPLFGSMVREQGDFEKGLKRGIIYSVVICAGIILVEQLVLGSPTSNSLAFPFLDLARIIYINRFIQHLEGYFAVIWLILGMTHIALNFYIAVYSFASIFNIINFRPLIFPIASLFFLLSQAPSFFYDSLLWYDIGLLQWGGMFAYANIFLCLTVGFIRRRKNVEPAVPN